MRIVTNNNQTPTKLTLTPFITLILLILYTGCSSTKTPITNPALSETSTPAQIKPETLPQPTADTSLPTTKSLTPVPQNEVQTTKPTELPVTKNDTNRGEFKGERAYQDIEYQIELGPRTPGSIAHAETIDYIEQQLIDADWVVKLQTVTIEGKSIKNIIASREDNEDFHDAEWIIIGTHYDSRIHADRDPDEGKKLQPVPGANDGASGVSILLELARILPINMDKNVWLVFFDAEDNGRIQDWDWVMGSQAFVSSLESKPDAVVIVDMVGDEDLNIFIEKNSDNKLVNMIWSIAASLGYTQYFIPFAKHSILDDHTPFLEQQIPAVLIIDLDYEHWHTTNDTIDKVSAHSLQIVGDVIHTWLTLTEEQ